MRNNRFIRHQLALICILCLILTSFLTSCGTDNPASIESNTNLSDTGEATAKPDATDDPSSTGTEDVLPTPEEEGPEIISLSQIYKDYFLIGTIYTYDSRSGPDKELTLNYFNAITPENIMKPEYMQLTEGNFSYDDADMMVAFAEENGLKAVGHTLVWHQQSGKWLGKNVSRDKAIEQLRSHITNIVGHYKGKMLSWDVVNEAIADGTTLPSDGDWTKCLRETQWLTSIGPDYLALAFTFAHEADPNVKLYYNDYNLDSKNKADIVNVMVKDLREQGIPIDGIGMQGHYNTDTSIGSVEYSLQLFTELGVEVSITELDVSVNGAEASGLTEEQETQQGIVYAKLFNLFKKYKDAIARVTFWGYLDNKSWRKDRFPCLFNADYSPKQAYYAVRDPEEYLAVNQDKNETALKVAQARLGTPVIDGEVDDIWSKCSEILVNNSIMAWEGAKGSVRIMWDESTVYALFDVQDSVLNKLSVNVYEQDSIEIFLDQINEKTSFYGPDDGQYRVNFEGAESLGTVPVTTGFTSAVKRIDGGYRVELAIPLLVKAKEGMVMGFDAQVNDSDANGARVSITKFNDLTDNSWSSTEKWGNLELMK